MGCNEIPSTTSPVGEFDVFESSIALRPRVCSALNEISVPNKSNWCELVSKLDLGCELVSSDLGMGSSCCELSVFGDDLWW